MPILKIGRVNTTSNSLNSVVPMEYVKKLALKAGMYLDWSMDDSGKMVVEVYKE